MEHYDIPYNPSMNTIQSDPQSISNSLNAQISHPTQVVDDDDDPHPTIPTPRQSVQEHRSQNRPEKFAFEERELKELEQKERLLQQHQLQLQDREELINQPHGIAVINNYEFFTTDANNDALPNRRGSQVDEENFRVTWQCLQYDVRILRNLTASELTRQLMQIALQSHENYNSIVCRILSHGYLNVVCGTDDQPVKIYDIANPFKGRFCFCPALYNKPQLFRTQICGDDDYRSHLERNNVLTQKQLAKGYPEQSSGTV